MNRYCGYARICVFLLAAAVFLPSLSFAGPRSSPALEITSQKAIQEHWDKRARAIKEKQTEHARQELNAILRLKLEEGINNLYTYSAALALEALEADRMEEAGKVADLLVSARDLAPDFAGPDFCEARIRLKRGQVAGAIASYIRGSKRRLTSFQGSIPVVFNVVIVVLGAVFWTVLLFSALMMARYAKVLGHDIQERLHGFSSGGATALVLSVLIFPVVFLPNLCIYAFIVILALWFYMNLGERTIAVVFALLILFVPSAFRLLGYSLTAHTEPQFRSMVRIREGIWSEGDIRVLGEMRRFSDERSTVADMTFSEASALLHSGRFEQAEPLFKELIDRSELVFESTLMLGNLYYQWKEYGEALRQYESAKNLNPESLAVHFNLAAALSRPELVDVSADYVEQAERELEIAKQIDSKRMGVLTRYQVLAPGQLVVDVRLPLERLYDNLMSESPQKTTTTRAMFAELSSGVPLKTLPPISVIILVIMGILTALGMRYEFARSCRRCGKTFCRRCQTAAREDVCARCFSAFEQTAGMDPRMREKVRAEARLYIEHRGMLARVISLLLPGSGHLLLGRSIRGVVFGLIAFTILLGILYREGILRSAWANPAPAVFIPTILATAVYIVFVALVLWNAAASSRQMK